MHGCARFRGGQTSAERHIFEEQILSSPERTDAVWQGDPKERSPWNGKKARYFRRPQYLAPARQYREGSRTHVAITNAPLLIDMFRHTDSYSTTTTCSRAFRRPRGLLQSQAGSFLSTVARDRTGKTKNRGHHSTHRQLRSERVAGAIASRRPRRRGLRHPLRHGAQQHGPARGAVPTALTSAATARTGLDDHPSRRSVSA